MTGRNVEYVFPPRPGRDAHEGRPEVLRVENLTLPGRFADVSFSSRAGEIVGLAGYEHAFVHETKDFLEAIAAGTDPGPSFEDGLRVQRVPAAVEQSAAEDSRFTTVEDS